MALAVQKFEISEYSAMSNIRYLELFWRSPLRVRDSECRLYMRRPLSNTNFSPLATPPFSFAVAMTLHITHDGRERRVIERTCFVQKCWVLPLRD